MRSSEVEDSGPDMARMEKFLRSKRRQERRYDCPPDTIVNLIDEETNESQAIAHNLSLGGIGLQNPFELTEGTVLIVEIRSPVDRLMYALKARVVHVTPRTDGDWLIGCQFQYRLDEDELRILLG